MRATPTTGIGGTSNYEELINLPKINDHEVIGEKTGHDLGLANLDDIPIYNLIVHTLYQASDFEGCAFNTDITYNNNERLSDYDIINVMYCNPLDSYLGIFDGTTVTSSTALSLSSNDNKGIFHCDFQMRTALTVFYDTYFKQTMRTASNEDGRYGPRVYKIEGIKLGVIV